MLCHVESMEKELTNSQRPHIGLSSKPTISGIRLPKPKIRPATAWFLDLEWLAREDLAERDEEQKTTPRALSAPPSSTSAPTPAESPRQDMGGIRMLPMETGVADAGPASF